MALSLLFSIEKVSADYVLNFSVCSSSYDYGFHIVGIAGSRSTGRKNEESREKNAILS